MHLAQRARVLACCEVTPFGQHVSILARITAEEMPRPFVVLRTAAASSSAAAAAVCCGCLVQMHKTCTVGIPFGAVPAPAESPLYNTRIPPPSSPSSAPSAPSATAATTVAVEMCTDSFVYFAYTSADFFIDDFHRAETAIDHLHVYMVSVSFGESNQSK
jgi:hypothetical protein